MAIAKSYYDGTWTKAVRHALIDLDMGVNDLAREIGRTRVHVSQTINARGYSAPTIKAICNALDIDDPDTMDREAAQETQEQPEPEPEADDLYAAFEALLAKQTEGETV